MSKKSHRVTCLLYLIGVLLYASCSEVRRDTGHVIKKEQISNDSADKIKNSIRGIGNDLFTPSRYTGANKTTIKYRLLPPEEINTRTSYPLVLVLHSSGIPIGTDNISQLGILAKLWAQPSVREKYPAFILAPQFPQRSSNYVPDQKQHILASSPDPCLMAALQLIDSLTAVLPIDKSRIYVTGFSMGASTAINCLVLRPDLFAAAISISGIPEFTRTDVLAKIPIWLIHGNADHENPIGSDSLLYRELQRRDGRHIKFWEIDSLDHAIYSELYTSNIIPAWLFRHTKNRRS